MARESSPTTGSCRCRNRIRGASFAERRGLRSQVAGSACSCPSPYGRPTPQLAGRPSLLGGSHRGRRRRSVGDRPRHQHPRVRRQRRDPDREQHSPGSHPGISVHEPGPRRPRVRVVPASPPRLPGASLRGSQSSGSQSSGGQSSSGDQSSPRRQRAIVQRGQPSSSGGLTERRRRARPRPRRRPCQSPRTARPPARSAAVRLPARPRQPRRTSPDPVAGTTANNANKTGPGTARHTRPAQPARPRPAPLHAGRSGGGADPEALSLTSWAPLTGMPKWLEDVLLAAGLLAATAYATEPVAVLARRRRQRSGPAIVRQKMHRRKI